MHTRISLVLAACLTLVSPCSAQDAATIAVTEISPASVDALVDRQMKAQSIVGLSVVVVVGGEIRVERHYGFEDREAQTAANPETMYRWASISKPVSAVAALQLVEMGKLDLDADVRKLVPEFPEKPWVLNARQILCHQSGIVHYTNGTVVALPVPASPEHPYEDVITSLDTFKMSPLLFEPGTKFSYTTHGFMLLGGVVQAAGGEAFWPQVRARVAHPAGMTSFRPDYQWEEIPHRAKGYRKLAGAVVPSTDTDVSWKLAGGGFISTVGDLSRFSIALMDGKLVKPETFEMMRTAQPLKDGTPTEYGLGLAVGTMGVRRICSHSGSQEKAATFLIMAPEDRTSVALMCNTEGTNLGELGKTLLREALREP